MRRKRVVIFMTAGVLCLISALALTGYNMWDERRASASVERGAAQLQAAIPQKLIEEQSLIPEEQPVMTTVEIENQYYVGILEIPALDLELPVQDEWSERLLKYSPCLYKGTISDGMIIAGHNYRSHFSGLPKLVIGDDIHFTDGDGNVWNYTVSTTEIISGHDAEAMEEGDWDLTLFTCTYGGQERYTVRCTMIIF